MLDLAIVQNVAYEHVKEPFQTWSPFLCNHGSRALVPWLLFEWSTVMCFERALRSPNMMVWLSTGS